MAAAAGGVYLMTKDKDGSNEEGEMGGSSDYSLLDPANIKAGLAAVYSGTPYYGEYEEKILVYSVKDGVVSYTDTAHIKEYDYSNHYKELDTFEPKAFDLNYMDTPPENVTVDHSGNVYTLNGSFSTSSFGNNFTYTYDSLKITYDGMVTEVSSIKDVLCMNDGFTIDTKYATRPKWECF